jgi:hypothetical protein
MLINSIGFIGTKIFFSLNLSISEAILINSGSDPGIRT